MNEFKHTPVLMKESIEGLRIDPTGIYVDCTLGGGGHSQQILQQLTTGHLYCFDQDPYALAKTKPKLEKISDRFTIIDSNFVHLQEELAKRQVHRVNGILFDLGVSSPQFDNATRGFSYQHNERLDMRMDTRQSLDAYTIVNTWSYKELVRILYQYSDEKFAKAIVRKIEQKREIAPIVTTFDLVDIIKEAMPAYALKKPGHPAKRTFQALRIAVNDELRVFERALQQAFDMIDVKGRIAVITFHSLEDKICKYAFQEATRQDALTIGLPNIPETVLPKFTLVTKKAIVSSKEELLENNRAHSARLRIIERVRWDV